MRTVFLLMAFSLVGGAVYAEIPDQPHLQSPAVALYSFQ